MKPAIRISRRTTYELSHRAAVGHRHNQLVKTACSLYASGLCPQAIAVQLRQLQPNLPRTEVAEIVHWVERRFIRPPAREHDVDSDSAKSSPLISTAEAKNNVERLLNGLIVDDYELWELSPWRPGDDPRLDATALIAALYDGDELINIVTDFVNRGDKLLPRGAGKTAYRDEWIRCVRRTVPESDAGGWIRMNPVCSKCGSGYHRAFCDSDVAAFRFVLLEADSIEMPLQLSLFAKLRLPITALITSGNRSVHAWVKIDAPNRCSYREQADALFQRLRLFGIDESNRNPSRLSRLPGATRCVNGQRELQKLVYLNPEPSAESII